MSNTPLRLTFTAIKRLVLALLLIPMAIIEVFLLGHCWLLSFIHPSTSRSVADGTAWYMGK